MQHLDDKIEKRPADPDRQHEAPVVCFADAGAGEGEREKQRGIERRTEQRGDKRRAPPDAVAEAVKDRHVEQLRAQESGARGKCDARGGEDNRQHHRNRKTDHHHLACRGWTETPVGQVGHQEGEGIGEGAPREIVGESEGREGMLDEDIRGDDHERHRDDG
jgi:hypothetical protein